MPESSVSIRSPFVVGVTGHRDIHPDCAEQIRAEVLQFIDSLRERLPNTEIRVMVGMAEGADMLVAQAALERSVAVDAVLPMPLAQYLPDFGSESVSVLDKLLEHPLVRRYELAGPVQSPGAGLDTQGSARDALYVNLSDTLVRKSNLLIALWDGVSTPLPGGTTDTVLKYLGAKSNTGAAIGFLDDGDSPAWGHQFVYWIASSRATSTVLPKARTDTCFLSTIGEHLLRRHVDMPPELQHQLTELDDYNREFELLQARDDFRSPATLMSELPEDLPAEDLASLRRIDTEYGKADALAIFHQRYSNRLFKYFSLMAAGMGLLFLVYAKLVAAKILLLAYLVILLLGLVVFYWLRGRNWFSKHLIYRVLAETMRTKFYLRMAAADRQVNAEDLIDLTGIDHFTGFSWITSVLKNVEPLEEPQAVDAVLEKRKLETVQKTWIDGQQQYFKAKVVRLEHSHHQLEQMKRLLFFALAIIAVILLLSATALSKVLLAGDASAKNLLMFLMGLLPVWLGIWELYENKLATRELLWQYRNQLSHFSRANLQLARAMTIERQAVVLADLGRKSLMESYLWTIHRFHREHEPPAAG